MAISSEWTSPDSLEQTTGTVYDAPEINSMLGNLKYLHAAPRIVVGRNTTFTVKPVKDTTVPYNEVLVNDGGWGWDLASSTVSVPVDGVYHWSVRHLWPDTPTTTQGTFRRLILRRGADTFAGERMAVVPFLEHALSTISASRVNDAITVACRHDANGDVTVDAHTTPWRSPLLIGQWIAPLDVEF